jgi:hypothetical protein
MGPSEGSYLLVFFFFLFLFKRDRIHAARQ